MGTRVPEMTFTWSTSSTRQETNSLFSKTRTTISTSKKVATIPSRPGRSCSGKREPRSMDSGEGTRRLERPIHAGKGRSVPWLLRPSALGTVPGNGHVEGNHRNHHDLCRPRHPNRLHALLQRLRMESKGSRILVLVATRMATDEKERGGWAHPVGIRRD